MQLLELSLPSAAENLALDEGLLEEAEAAPEAAGLLRLWECPQQAVVLGRSGQVAVEVDAAACARLGVTILRRASGGGTVVIGPGCLQYSLVLPLREFPAVATIERAHALVLSRVARAVSAALAEAAPEGARTEPVEIAGDSDLVYRGRKFSGNSLRMKRQAVLYHGTLLYAYPLAELTTLLREPPRQPGYRQRRPHEQFVANLPASASALRRALIAEWQAHEPRSSWPQDLVRRLVAEKYALPAWNLER